MSENRWQLLLLHPRDPLIFRDARPFTPDGGNRARTLDWPLPQTVAGALRTLIGTERGFAWETEEARRKARGIKVCGPLPVVRRDGAADAPWEPYLPAPRDALLYTLDSPRRERVHALRPRASWPEGAGCDLPGWFHPLGTSTDDFKPDEAFPFWSLAATAAWLREPRGTTRPPEAAMLRGLPRETRTHVKIAAETQAAEPGRLFSTSALVFHERPRPDPNDPGRAWPAVALLCRVTGTDWRAAPGLLPLGGERRTVALEPAGDAPLWPAVPAALSDALAGTTLLRLQLVTPAVFAGGWCPDFARPGGAGAPPDVPPSGALPDLADVGPQLTLISAVVGRRIPISGWNVGGRPFDGGKGAGPKATRYAVPAGSVYFFAADRPLTEADVRRLWLRSICGRHQDRLDGYGLVVPGTWDWHR